MQLKGLPDYDFALPRSEKKTGRKHESGKSKKRSGCSAAQNERI